MAFLPEGNVWESVYQKETTDAVLGGLSGTANTAEKNLTNRTGYLKQIIDELLIFFNT